MTRVRPATPCPGTGPVPDVTMMTTTETRALDRVLDAARDGTAYGLPLASGPTNKAREEASTR